MTTEEVRELDAWIAEHVMGWFRQSFDNEYTRHNLLVPCKFRAERFRKHGWVDGLEFIRTFPHYSADPAAAMQVLKRCAEKAGNTNTVSIWFSERGWQLETVCVDAIAPTLELAICLFARKLFS